MVSSSLIGFHANFKDLISVTNCAVRCIKVYDFCSNPFPLVCINSESCLGNVVY